MDLVYKLDREVQVFLDRLTANKGVAALLTGSISKRAYIALLWSCYFVERHSYQAVIQARDHLQNCDPYLSKRFGLCSESEIGHAKVALMDLDDLGQGDQMPIAIPAVGEYEEFLFRAAEHNLYGLLGHSYLFESASSILFPKVKPGAFPSRFALLHAREDPGHVLSVRRTVRVVERKIPESQVVKVTTFAECSGAKFMELLDQLLASQVTDEGLGSVESRPLS